MSIWFKLSLLYDGYNVIQRANVLSDIFFFCVLGDDLWKDFLLDKERCGFTDGLWEYHWQNRGTLRISKLKSEVEKDAHLISESEGWIRMHKLLGRTAWEILYGEQVWAYNEILDWMIWFYGFSTLCIEKQTNPEACCSIVMWCVLHWLFYEASVASHFQFVELSL